jgi:hypothetical protein
MNTMSILAGLIFLMGWKSSSPEIPSIHNDINRESGTIGDRFRYTVKITTVEDDQVVLPENQPLLSSFVVKERMMRTRERKKVKETVFEYELVSYDVGVDTIPSLTFVVHSGEDSYELRTEKIPVEIKSVAPGMTGEEDIRDIKPQIGMKLSFWYYIIGVVTLLSLLALAYFFIRRKRRKRESSEHHILPPWETALQRLKELEGEKPLTREEIKKFYIRLSFILREYFELLYDFPAMENTTTEILGSLRKIKEYREFFTDTNNFLKRSDLVKFAKYFPPVFDKEKEMVFVKEIIEETKREEEDGEEEEEKNG